MSSIFLDVMAGVNQGLDDFETNKKAEEERQLKLSGERQRQELIKKREEREQTTFDQGQTEFKNNETIRLMERQLKEAGLSLSIEDKTKNRDTILELLEKGYEAQDVATQLKIQNTKEALFGLPEIMKNVYGEELSQGQYDAVKKLDASLKLMEKIQAAGVSSRSGTRALGSTSSSTKVTDAQDPFRKNISSGVDVIKEIMTLNPALLQTDQGKKLMDNVVNTANTLFDPSTANSATQAPSMLASLYAGIQANLAEFRHATVKNEAFKEKDDLFNGRGKRMPVDQPEWQITARPEGTFGGFEKPTPTPAEPVGVLAPTINRPEGESGPELPGFSAPNIDLTQQIKPPEPSELDVAVVDQNIREGISMAERTLRRSKLRSGGMKIKGSVTEIMNTLVPRVQDAIKSLGPDATDQEIKSVVDEEIAKLRGK